MARIIPTTSALKVPKKPLFPSGFRPGEATVRPRFSSVYTSLAPSTGQLGPHLMGPVFLPNKWFAAMSSISVRGSGGNGGAGGRSDERALAADDPFVKLRLSADDLLFPRDFGVMKDFQYLGLSNLLAAAFSLKSGIALILRAALLGDENPRVVGLLKGAVYEASSSKELLDLMIASSAHGRLAKIYRSQGKAAEAVSHALDAASINLRSINLEAQLQGIEFIGIAASAFAAQRRPVREIGCRLAALALAPQNSPKALRVRLIEAARLSIVKNIRSVLNSDDLSGEVDRMIQTISDFISEPFCNRWSLYFTGECLRMLVQIVAVNHEQMSFREFVLKARSEAILEPERRSQLIARIDEIAASQDISEDRRIDGAELLTMMALKWEELGEAIIKSLVPGGDLSRGDVVPSDRDLAHLASESFDRAVAASISMADIMKVHAGHGILRLAGQTRFPFKDAEDLKNIMADAKTVARAAQNLRRSAAILSSIAVGSYIKSSAVVAGRHSRNAAVRMEYAAALDRSLDGNSVKISNAEFVNGAKVLFEESIAAYRMSGDWRSTVRVLKEAAEFFSNIGIPAQAAAMIVDGVRILKTHDVGAPSTELIEAVHAARINIEDMSSNMGWQLEELFERMPETREIFEIEEMELEAFLSYEWPQYQDAIAMKTIEDILVLLRWDGSPYFAKFSTRFLSRMIELCSKSDRVDETIQLMRTLASLYENAGRYGDAAQTWISAGLKASSKGFSVQNYFSIAAANFGRAAEGSTSEDLSKLGAILRPSLVALLEASKLGLNNHVDRFLFAFEEYIKDSGKKKSQNKGLLPLWEALVSEFEAAISGKFMPERLETHRSFSRLAEIGMEIMLQLRDSSDRDDTKLHVVRLYDLAAKNSPENDSAQARVYLNKALKVAQRDRAIRSDPPSTPPSADWGTMVDHLRSELERYPK